MSCKAAVKGNQKISVAECDTILQELLQLDNPFAWTGKEFEKKLKEYVGHSPLQVLMGAILGLAIAVGMGYVYGYFG